MLIDTKRPLLMDQEVLKELLLYGEQYLRSTNLWAWLERNNKILRVYIYPNYEWSVEIPKHQVGHLVLWPGLDKQKRMAFHWQAFYGGPKLKLDVDMNWIFEEHGDRDQAQQGRMALRDLVGLKELPDVGFPHSKAIINQKLSQGIIYAIDDP